MVVFYVLAKRVYPVIKKEFYIEFPEYIYSEISMNASQKQQTENGKYDDNNRKLDKSYKEDICLSKSEFIIIIKQTIQPVIILKIMSI